MEENITASKLFTSSHKFIEAYHTVLQPLCRETGLPPMAIDILMFFANNPENNTASDICQCRGLKSGIVSVHIERLVNEGFLLRQIASHDRRKTQLKCTELSEQIIIKGRELQNKLAYRLLTGLNENDISVFRNCLAVLSNNAEEIRKYGL